jgi:ribulose 1,5-bisphosphate synthetase/thiazole synthase
MFRVISIDSERITKLNDYDVAIVGGGNATLTAAITCAKNGRKALLLESVPLLETVDQNFY